MERQCIKCKKIKLVIEFNFKNKRTGRRNARCKECTRVDIRTAYRKNRKHYLVYRADYNRQLRKNVNNYIFHYFATHHCVDCGIKDPIVLEFDHVRGKKLMAVSTMVRQRYPLKMIQLEIEKCDCGVATAMQRGRQNNLVITH